MPPKRKAAVWRKKEDAPEQNEEMQLRRSSRRSTVERTSQSTPQISPTKKHGTPIRADNDVVPSVRAQDSDGNLVSKDSIESEDTIAFRRLLAETTHSSIALPVSSSDTKPSTNLEVRRSPRERNRYPSPADDLKFDDVLVDTARPSKRSRLSDCPQLFNGKTPPTKKVQTSPIPTGSSITGSADHSDLRPLGKPPKCPLLNFDFDNSLGGNSLDTPDSPEQSPSPPSEESKSEIFSPALHPNEAFGLGRRPSAELRDSDLDFNTFLKQRDSSVTTQPPAGPRSKSQSKLPSFRKGGDGCVLSRLQGWAKRPTDQSKAGPSLNGSNTNMRPSSSLPRYPSSSGLRSSRSTDTSSNIKESYGLPHKPQDQGDMESSSDDFTPSTRSASAKPPPSVSTPAPARPLPPSTAPPPPPARPLPPSSRAPPPPSKPASTRPALPSTQPPPSLTIAPPNLAIPPPHSTRLPPSLTESTPSPGLSRRVSSSAAPPGMMNFAGPRSMQNPPAVEAQRAWLDRATRDIPKPYGHSGHSVSSHKAPESRPQPIVHHPNRATNLPHKPFSAIGTPMKQHKAPEPNTQSAVDKPRISHAPHSDSKLDKDFKNCHWLPYPLGLLPYDSWHKLHNRAEVYPPLPFRCPKCKKQQEANVHQRKIFLVAERLSFHGAHASRADIDLNEELNWAVNYELGILEPFVEDPQQVPGGKRSQTNRFYPYCNEHEMKEALNLMFASENITELNWSLWLDMQKSIQRLLGNDEPQDSKAATSEPTSKRKQPLQPSAGNRAHMKTPPADIDYIDLTILSEKPNTNGKEAAWTLSTPPSSLSGPPSASSQEPVQASIASLPSFPAVKFDDTLKSTNAQASSSSPDMRITSFSTLQDFYSLLDQIERTSYVGARFLEAYAERLHNDMCKDCWFKRYVDTEEVDDDGQ